MGEDEAISRLCQGDIGGLETLVRLHQVRAVRAAYLITRDQALAEDIVQAAFVRVYERIAQFDPQRKFAPWFLRSVVNDALKAAARREKSISFDYAPDSGAPPLADLLPDPQASPEELLERAETRQAVLAALDSLPPDQRAAIVLRYYLDLSEADVAARLNSPLGTIKWRLHAARNRLRILLAHERDAEIPTALTMIIPDIKPQAKGKR